MLTFIDCDLGINQNKVKNLNTIWGPPPKNCLELHVMLKINHQLPFFRSKNGRTRKASPYKTISKRD